MFYKLLGMAVWKFAKVFLRRKVSAAPTPKPLVAGGVVLALVAVAAVALSKRSTSDS